MMQPSLQLSLHYLIHCNLPSCYKYSSVWAFPVNAKLNLALMLDLLFQSPALSSTPVNRVGKLFCCRWDVQSLVFSKLCLNTHLGSRARIWRIWIWCNLFWFLQLRQLWINKQNASKPLKWSNCTPPTWNGNNWTVKWQICNATPKHNCRKRTW